jgi:hypothetical protein
LPFGVAAVGTMGVCVEEFAQSDTVRGFGRSNFRCRAIGGSSSESDEVDAKRVVDLLNRGLHGRVIVAAAAG